MASGEDGLGVGADLVGDFAGAAKGSVTADDDKVDPAALYEVASCVVGNDLVGDALLGEFPRGQGRALRTRAGFVAEDMKLPALGLGGVHRSGRASDINKREPARIAVSENVRPV